jgi:hypothetical protein
MNQRQYTAPYFASEKHAGRIETNFVTQFTGNPDQFLKHPYPNWVPLKHHQWMILSRNHLMHLKKSPVAMTFLAYAEWTGIPDEAYFAMVLVNHFSDLLMPKGKSMVVPRLRVVNSFKRWLKFPTGASHPETITSKRLPEISDQVACNDAVFCRKVDAKITPVLDELRAIDDRVYFGKPGKPTDVIPEDFMSRFIQKQRDKSSAKDQRDRFEAANTLYGPNINMA